MRQRDECSVADIAAVWPGDGNAGDELFDCSDCSIEGLRDIKENEKGE